MIRLSAVIITRNEERNVDRCLDSLEGLVDEVVVVDSGSTDGTMARCRARGARVVEHGFEGFTAQKNFAVAQATHDHVLSLDADEALSPALRLAVQAAKEDWRADGYDFNRLNHFGEKPIRTCGWYPDCKIRLWDRRRGRWSGGLVHETVTLDEGARLAHLEGDLLHSTFQHAGQMLGKLHTYAELWAEENAGRRVGTPGLLLRTVAAFLKSYLLKGGIRDGYEGLAISVGAANHTFYKYARLLEGSREAPGARSAGAADLAAGPLHLVEPTLAGDLGHELSFARSLWEAADGHPVRVWAGRRAQVAGLPPSVKLVPWFSRRLRKLQAPLLYRRLLGQPGRILVATATRLDLLSLDWAAGGRAIPPGKVSLYFHWFRDSPGKRRAFARVARSQPGLRVLAPTEAVAEILRACGFAGAEAVPYPITPVVPAAGAPFPFSHLLFAGAARQDKGFGRMVDLVELLARQGETLPVVYQRTAQPERLEPASRRDLDRLDRCAYRPLRAQPDPLPAEAYAAQFSGGIVLQPYHQGDFADRVSGVTLDALSAGCPVVTLAGTWMAKVVERFGAGVVVDEAGPETLLAAIRRIQARYGELQAAALLGGRVLQEENSAKRLWTAITADQPFRAPALSDRTRQP